MRAWTAWLGNPNRMQNPYFEKEKGKQDSGRVMEAQLADVGVLCDAADQFIAEDAARTLELVAKALPYVEAALAAAGDKADADLIRLQHDMAEVARLAANA